MSNEKKITVEVPVEVVIAAIHARSQGVLYDVACERLRQDAKWGGVEHDDLHDPADFVHFVNKQVRAAREATRASEPPVKPAEFRERMVKVAALAVAAIQSHDRKQEKAGGPVLG
jgi:hypothetical protein